MDYIELTVPAADEAAADVLTAELAEFPFESFTCEAGWLKAYAPVDAVAPLKEQVDSMLDSMGVEGYRYVLIEAVNWNALWESNFEPVEIGSRCTIRAPFHAAPADGRLDVVIMPKMSFGTGHHATTWLMGSALMDCPMEGRLGLDMGSGTGVLAIMAALLGARGVDAVDIDEWAWENACENIAANGVQGRVTALLGDVSVIEGRTYDFIAANINLNILLRDMPAYCRALHPGGDIFFSGIFTSDLPALSKRAQEHGLTILDDTSRQGWACLHARKG